jgi:rhodanese-related sulfurtransferase
MGKRAFSNQTATLPVATRMGDGAWPAWELPAVSRPFCAHARARVRDEVRLPTPLNVFVGVGPGRGAVNIPPECVDALAEHRIPDLDTLVVVCCANPSCESSVEVAQRLVELGNRNVLHYAGGKEDWARSGLPLEGARV